MKRLDLALPQSLIQHLPNLAGQRRGREWLREKRNAGIEHSLLHDGVVGVARHEQDLGLRAKVLQTPRQVGPTHFTHHHVGEQQVDPSRLLLTHAVGFEGILQFQNPAETSEV